MRLTLTNAWDSYHKRGSLACPSTSSRGFVGPTQSQECPSSLYLASWTDDSNHDQVSSPSLAFANLANVAQHSVGDMSRILLIVHPAMGGYLQSESAWRRHFGYVEAHQGGYGLCTAFDLLQTVNLDIEPDDRHRQAGRSVAKGQGRVVRLFQDRHRN